MKNSPESEASNPLTPEQQANELRKLAAEESGLNPMKITTQDRVTVREAIELRELAAEESGLNLIRKLGCRSKGS